MMKRVVQGSLLLCGVYLLTNLFLRQSSAAWQPALAAPEDALFVPSQARTSEHQLIPVKHFFPAARCAGCHQDTHAMWAQSLHRNAAREPFYRESADLLLKTRGIEMTRHCESCHTPIALVSGALTKDARQQTAPFTPLDEEGITCSVCHSITEARLDGTGSYTLRRPALLAQPDGTPIYERQQQPITDAQILADIPGHKRAVMRPLLRQPEFCATCHKVDAPPALNGYKHMRGFSAYDDWQQSGASHETLLPFYPRAQRADCRACHMHKVTSTQDRAAKQGLLASHRWLGANTAAPLFYQQAEQVTQTQTFLQNNVLAIDLFALRRDAANSLLAPLDETVQLTPGETITVDVVIANRNAAHTFPPEVRDLYEAWVEFTARDATGQLIFQSGLLQAEGKLEESAHVYKQILLDAQGRQLTRHQIWTTNIKAYDNAIAPGRADVVRYRFPLPATPAAQAITLQARVLYRRFNQEYTDYILARQGQSLVLPSVPMATATLTLGATATGPSTVTAAAQPTPAWQRWNDYGIGLLEQAQYGAATAAFRQAAQLQPRDANLLVNAALAEMRTERFGPAREQYQKATQLLAAALQLTPGHPRAQFYQALIARATGQHEQAAVTFAALAGQWPRDREVQRQLGQSYFSAGQWTAAVACFEQVLAIDPTDFQAWQFLAPLYQSLGRPADAARAQERYLQWRDDPQAEGIASRFFARHPEWGEERNSAHRHEAQSQRRPILTGAQAVPLPE